MRIIEEKERKRRKLRLITEKEEKSALILEIIMVAMRRITVTMRPIVAAMICITTTMVMQAGTFLTCLKEKERQFSRVTNFGEEFGRKDNSGA